MDADPSRDERIVRILEELTSSLRRTGKADVEAAARADPDVGDELRELWAMVEVTEEVAKPDDETIDAPRAPREEARPRDPLTPTPGDLRDHEILEEIGRGGMGVVYRARQKSLDRIVALKMMLRGPLASRAETDRFRAEAEAAARLDHPNIAPVYEVGAAGDQPYFTMRFVEGTTLARRLAEGPLPCRDAARLLAVIARAVHYAHERGVLHRDLKPQNILIGGDDVPYITDFGLAKRIEGGSSLTETGAILGTPSYMSPEQAAGRKGQVGPASDVYALGAILYHALTGRPPFQAATAVDVVLSVLGEDPLPPRLLNPKVDRDLEMITLKCLQKPADLRYASARALAEDLEAYQNGETISARTTGLRLLVSRAFRETHHAAILENWGLLWMWHSAAVLVLCVATNVFQWRGVASPAAYMGIWTLGLGTWAAIFWSMRRRAGPITFVEKQVAHVWGASILTSSMLFLVEMLLGLEPLTLSPVLGLVSGTVFFVKAGILTGMFYVQSAVSFLTAIPMALFPRVGISIFGLVTAACFFIPGLKYHRQRRRGLKKEAARDLEPGATP